MDVRCLECGEQDGPRPYSSSVFLSLAIQHVMYVEAMAVWMQGKELQHGTFCVLSGAGDRAIWVNPAPAQVSHPLATPMRDPSRSPIKIARHAYEVSQITGHGSAGRAVSSDPARHFQGIDARMQHMPKSKGVSDEARQRVPCYVPSVCMHNKVAPAVLQSACC